MAILDIGSSTEGENIQKDFSVDPATTDSPSESNETPWTNAKWSKQLGFYESIPELNTSIDAKATWTVGKGFKADDETTLLLDTIKGTGIDTFNTILENMIRDYHIGGDAFAEIIRDDEDNLINLKVLGPDKIITYFNKQGLISRYEYITPKKTSKLRKDQVFHLCRNRVADSMHGTSIIDKLEKIIEYRNQAMEDWNIVLHRNVDPLWIVHLDTDDQTKINEFKTKWENVKKNKDVFFVPKDIVVPELVTTAGNATLNPLPWIENLNNYFYEAVGTPKIIIGGAQEITEASAKIAYLAFQQTIEEEQLYIEEQVLAQLNLFIELEFPASLENELLSDKKKDETNGASQPSETTTQPPEETGGQQPNENLG